MPYWCVVSELHFVLKVTVILTRYSTAFFMAFVCILTSAQCGPDSSVGIAARYGLEGPGIKSQWYSSTLSLTWALDGGGWLTPRPGRFTPEKETR
jgi:hypothetical protein